MPGLLIVNADDFGFSRRVTQAAVEAFEAGGISSATAMVWMRDSARAASVAHELGLPLGLHLNFTVEFAAASVPVAARNRQLKLLDHVRRAGDGSWPPSRPATLSLRDAVRDQLERLTETYGEPTHVDGHHHVHLEAAVLDAVPVRFPVRPPLSVPDRGGNTDPSRSEPVPGRRSPRWAFALEHVHPGLGGEGDAVLARAEREAVEVMAHPAHEGQLAALVGEGWREMVVGLRMGSYVGLPH